MATAVFQGPGRPELVVARRARAIPSLSEGRSASAAGDLTIHRITASHHGRTLLTLGHAAEYLADSRRYSAERYDYEAHVEALHILMGLSRRVFDEVAERRGLPRRVQDLVVERAVRVIEWGGSETWARDGDV
jgi:hypothetical protein